jgi:hypothetical protein
MGVGIAISALVLCTILLGGIVFVIAWLQLGSSRPGKALWSFSLCVGLDVLVLASQWLHLAEALPLWGWAMIVLVLASYACLGFAALHSRRGSGILDLGSKLLFLIEVPLVALLVVGVTQLRQ